MSRAVDYGIDLGTTNSVIARMERKGPRVIGDGVHQVTPSAVGFNSLGEMVVGWDALGGEQRPELQFKREMGSDTMRSTSRGLQMTAVELSSEILKKLKSQVKLRYDETLTHAVITVPAMFMQPQCEATSRAARLAGIEPVALLQEPIAAATAYLSDNPVEGDFLVYDLGGGTFDVSVIRLRNGTMQVLGHGGDNWLGGADFDKKLGNWIQRELNAQGVDLGPLSSQQALWSFIREVEGAKIGLSLRETVDLDLSDTGLSVRRLTIQRRTLDALVEEDLGRTVRLARDLLSRVGLEPNAIDALFLVGGPTKMPIVRSTLRDQLQILISLEQDPMTAVAEGAAIRAAGMRVSSSTVADHDDVLAIDLHFEPPAQSRLVAVSGQIDDRGGRAKEIRVLRADDEWDTGWALLKNGSFMFDSVRLTEDIVSEYRIEVRDRSGNLIPVDPQTFIIRFLIEAARTVAAYNYGVAIKDLGFRSIIEAGVDLPHKKEQTLQSAVDVRQGSSDELKITLLEGLGNKLEHLLKIGECTVRGSDLKIGSIRQGDEVKVTIRVDENQNVSAVVLIPKIDIEVTIPCSSIQLTPDVSEVSRQLECAHEEHELARPFLSGEDSEEFNHQDHYLEILQAEAEDMGQLDANGRNRMVKKLSDLRSRSSRLFGKYECSIVAGEARAYLDRAEALARQFNDFLDIDAIALLRRDLDSAEELRDAGRVKKTETRALEIFWKHFVKTPECWIGLVQWLRANLWQMDNDPNYLEYVRRAEACLRDDDLQGARINALAARQLLPDDADSRYAGHLM